METWAHSKVMYEEHKGWFYRLHMLSTQAHRHLNKEEEKHDPNL